MSMEEAAGQPNNMHENAPNDPAREVIDRALGDRAIQPILVPRSTETDELTDTPLEQALARQRNLETLHGRVHEVLLPYEDMLKAQVPPVSQNARSKLGKKVGIARTRKWEYKKTSDEMTLNYDCSVNFTQGSQINTLQEAKIIFLSQYDRRHWEHESAANLTASFSEDKIAKLALAWHQEYPATLLALAKGTTLGKFIKDSCVLGGNGYDSTLIEVELLDDEPSIRIVQGLEGLHGAAGRRICLDSKFIFRPEKNILTHQFNNKALHRGVGVSTRAEMTTDELKTIIQDTLGLIPAINLNQTPGL